jgi:5-methylthioadenosine/S-adenosylhomocysteine deaminase
MNPQSIDTLIEARWIIPAEPTGLVYTDHALAIDAGRIVALLTQAEATTRFAPRQRLALAEHALIPGLINAHTHAAMTLLRGYADDLPLMEWLRDHVWPAEARHLGPDFVRDGSRLAVAEMLRGGVTCFNDMYFFPEETAQAAIEAGMRAVIGLILLEFPTAWAASAEDYLRRGIEVHDRYRHHPLVRTAFAPHAPYTVADESFRRLAIYAGELNIPVHMHVHETADEIKRSLATSGERPLQRLDRLGLLSSQLLAVHMTQIEANEIPLLAARGVHVVHCPESNLKLASGYCPIAALQRAAVNTALGTDGAASNNDLDMFGEMRTAALLAKAVAGDATALPAAAALCMATINGARALGIDDVTGSLVPGKQADVVAVDFGGIESQPVHDPLSQLVYASGRQQVRHVWVAGRQVVESGRLTTLDGVEITQAARTWRDRLRH